MPDCYFRAGIDDPSGWECWTLSPDELTIVEQCQAHAANTAVVLLQDAFGRASEQLGGTELAEQIGTIQVDERAAFAIARALTAADYFCARAAPPRAQPGGTTNARNRRVWEKLRAHMLKRLSAALALEAANAIFEQCVFARVPTERIPTATFERSLAAALAGNAGYSSVDITLDIDQEPRGGIVWLDTQSREALEAVSRAISDRRACLLELLRAAGTAPSALEIVVAYALDRTIDAETLTRLRIWDPRSGRERCLDVAKQPDGGLRYIESGIDGRPIDDDERLSIKALRAWKVPESAPPLFGLRRILRWQPPWRAAWWLKRWFAVRFRVKRP